MMRVAVMAMVTIMSGSAQVVITNSGSTNRAGMNITVEATGPAVIEDRHGNKTQVNLDGELQAKFMKDVEAASPVNEVSANHCMKSVSFGSRTFVRYKGIRSPDLSCPGQRDPLAAALQKDLEAIMSQVRAVVPQERRR
jgi:hypothetical protein